jgi:aspartyl/asparaginyl-tRNA synthetase
MTEFMGLDIEMAFNEDYSEVLDMIDRLIEYMFNGLATEHKHDIQLISQQYPVEPIATKFPSPLLTFAEGIDMLRAAGVKQANGEWPAYDVVRVYVCVCIINDRI